MRLLPAAILILSSLRSAAFAQAQEEPLAVTDFILEPIVITAPRRKLPPERRIDPRINAVLLRLLRQKSELRPEDAADAGSASSVFAGLTTLTGHMLRLRYTELGFLLTEGLAGVGDFEIQNELESIARSSRSPQMRASAMVSLAYTKEERFVPLFQEGLRDQNLTVRLGALESMIVSGSQSASFALGDAAQGDQSPALRALAAAAYWKGGNPSGRESLMTMADSQDWFVRALAVNRIGELGGVGEKLRLMDMLGREQNPVVRSEIVLALLRVEKRR